MMLPSDWFSLCLIEKVKVYNIRKLLKYGNDQVALEPFLQKKENR